jgi:hypothetical protein
MSLQFILIVVAAPLVFSLVIGLLLLRKAVVPARATKPAPPALPAPRPTLMIRQDGHDVLVAELAGLLRRHLDLLPQNYDAISVWERLVDDTVPALTRHKLAPVAKLAAERQCATTH